VRDKGWTEEGEILIFFLSQMAYFVA